MTTTALPTTWSWDDRDGCTHMVSEGAALETGAEHHPQLRTLCGDPVPVGVHRAHGLHQCDDCYQQLTKLISDAFDLLS